MTHRTIANRDLLATVWTWSGDAAPARFDESSPLDIRTRLDAITAAGWTGVSFVHGDLMKLAGNIGLPELKKMLDGHGIQRVELEFISNWWTDGADRAASDAVRRDLFAAAPILGVNTIKVGAELQAFGAGDSPVGMDRFAQAFDELATDAGNHGLRIAMEPMPMSNLPTIIDGANMVRGVGNPNGGLVVDTWHVGRGGTSWADMAAALPMDHVFVVEVDDADFDVVGSLWEDTINNRRLPGDGALDTAGFMAAMHDLGWRGYWGVEIISEQHRQMPVGEALALTAARTNAALDAAELIPPAIAPTATG
jgi:sugar phosphate isomerase/epimerase